MGKPPDILLIHCPKSNDFYEPLGKMSFINVIPSGLFVMAGYLDKKGHQAKILHMGIFRYRHKDTNLHRHISRNIPRLAAFSLFWHHQAWDVLQNAKKLRENFPNLPIIIGGLTAAYFADEIISEYPYVDSVITGDGEEALDKILNLLKKFDRNGLNAPQDKPNDGPDDERFLDKAPIEEIMRIPNLKLRWQGQVITTPGQAFTPSEILDEADDWRLDLMEDHDIYPQISTLPSIWLEGKNPAWHNTHLDREEGTFFPQVGRGCPRNCTWCGRQKRPSPVFRNAKAVVESIGKAAESGYQGVYFTYDPHPGAQKYYLDLFNLMKTAMNCRFLSIYFECWGLPGRKFIQAFRDTFPRGIIGLSPDTGDEELRIRHKEEDYSDKALYKTIDNLEELKLPYDLFFGVGLPGENQEKFGKTKKMIDTLRVRGEYLDQIILQSIQLEPGSPWFEDPKSYGIEARYRTLADYVKAHGPGNRGSFTSLGYVIPGYFKDVDCGYPLVEFENRILALRCRTNCFLKVLLPEGRDIQWKDNTLINAVNQVGGHNLCRLQADMVINRLF